MKGLPAELFYVLAVAAYLLFRYIKNRLGQQAQPDSAQHERLEDVSDEVKETPRAPSASIVGVGPFSRTAAPSASAPLPQRRFARRSLMGSKLEVQNAIVIATVLGPCRAFEPHDVR
jgi:hypothetical protein